MERNSNTDASCAASSVIARSEHWASSMPFESDASEDMAAELSVIIHRLPDHEVRQRAPYTRIGPCSCTQHMPLA